MVESDAVRVGPLWAAVGYLVAECSLWPGQMIGPPPPYGVSVTELGAALRSLDAHVRHSAVAGFPARNSQAGVDVVRAALRDPVARVRAEVIRALAPSGPI
jgi:HEAT repeat protein